MSKDPRDTVWLWSAWMTMGIRGATVHDYHVIPGRRGTSAAIKMLHGLRRWAVARATAALYVSASSGIGTGRTDRFPRRIGFRCMGGNYVAYLQETTE